MYARSYFLLSCHTNCFTHYIHAPKQGDKRGKTEEKNNDERKQQQQHQQQMTRMKSQSFFFAFIFETL